MTGPGPMIEIRVIDKRVLEWGLPKYESDNAAAIDLFACIDAPIEIAPGTVPGLIPTGIEFHIGDPNVVGMVAPRSGAGHRGLVLGNLVGIIDPDYQGQVFVSAWNRNPPGTPPIRIVPSERIAQMLFVPILRPTFVQVEEFTGRTERGNGGFGSTGTVR